ARGLGVKELVVSPTFIYYQRYQGRLSFCHIDAYRLENMSLEDQEQLGLIDCFGEQDVAVVEWPEYAAEFLPIDTIRLTIRRLQQEEREFIFDFDAKAHDWLREVLK
ncbi:MAG: tRNA (adenosine(37)-N6)-threonylcarbamoyltransferase complex ATPase subunit type 1 TsaE, partial [Clostridiales bacterium]